MKALRYQPASDRFSIAEQPVPEPGEHDVLVRVHVCGLNPVDAKIDQWHATVPGMTGDWVAGLDVSGEIVARGPAVTSWRIGDGVLYHGDMFRPHGGFAEFAIQDARTLVAHPDVAPDVAAATPCAGWTAWRALVDKLHARGVESLFIAGGAGGVGTVAIQLARCLGVAQVITTASRANHDYVRSLGATAAIDYHEEDAAALVMALTNGQGVRIALDTVGGDTDLVTAAVLGYEGQMVELVRTVRPEAYPDAFMKGLGFHQLSLGSGHRHGQPGRDTLIEAARQVSALLQSGSLKVPRLTTIRLEDTGDALKEMRGQRTVGKIVMKLPVV
jgi:NADPH:quinone reductase-like Zn-dependent oxidoreductase